MAATASLKPVVVHRVIVVESVLNVAGEIVRLPEGEVVEVSDMQALLLRGVAIQSQSR